MRIARFTAGGDPMFGIVQEKDGEDYVYGLTGDPLYTEITPNGKILPLAEVRLLAPVIPRSKIIGVGRNYSAHAAERGVEAPEMPLLFQKPNTAVIGPGDPVRLPEYAEELAIEAEVAVVIKTLAKGITPDQVDDVILGYTCANDLTVRAMQDVELQWFRAKAFDGSCPLGPWIETDVDIDAGLNVSSTIDGASAQNGNTSEMIHDIRKLVSEISQVVTLLPGDVILTGTPAGSTGVKTGQRVEVTVQGIGTLMNPVL